MPNQVHFVQRVMAFGAIISAYWMLDEHPLVGTDKWSILRKIYYTNTQKPLARARSHPEAKQQKAHENRVCERVNDLALK